MGKASMCFRGEAAGRQTTHTHMARTLTRHIGFCGLSVLQNTHMKELTCECKQHLALDQLSAHKHLTKHECIDK